MMPDPLDRLLGGPDPPATPRPEFAEALLDRLVAMLAAPADDPVDLKPPPPEPDAAVSPHSRPLPDPSKWSRPWSRLRFAAILAVVLAGAVLVRWLDRADRPIEMPAVVVPATPTATPIAGVTDVRLVDAALAADALPVGTTNASLAYCTLLPGTRSTWTTFEPVHLVYVVDGPLTVRPDGPTQVTRSGSTWETVGSGEEIVLEAGDAVLLIGRTTIGFDNTATEPAQIVDWVVAATAGDDHPRPHSWVVSELQVPGGDGVTLTEGPARLVLRRVVLAPGVELPMADGAGLRFTVSPPVNAEGTPVLSFVGRVSNPEGGPIGNPADWPLTLFVLTLEADPGSQ
jgi:hypothetical protein